MSVIPAGPIERGPIETYVQHLHELRDRDEHTRQRLVYSQAYYERHPGRIRDQWYAVGDGSPELPAGGISARERQA